MEVGSLAWFDEWRSWVMAILSALAVAAGVLWRHGQLASTVDDHARRLDRLEDVIPKLMTRDDFKASHAALEARIDILIGALVQARKE